MTRLIIIVLFILLYAMHTQGQVINKKTDITNINGRYYDRNGNEYIYIDSRFIRAVVGYSSYSLRFKAKFANGADIPIPLRTASAMYLRNEFRIISAFMDGGSRFAVRDAMYLDMALGALTSAPLPYISGRPEGKFCVNSSFGYQILAGYRSHAWGVFGGADITATSCFMGSAFDPEHLMRYYIPFMVRGEYRPWGGKECRIVLCAFSNFGSHNRYSGVFADFPLARRKRFYLTFQYTIRDVRMTVVNYNTYPAVLSQWMLGLKMGSIY